MSIGYPFRSHSLWSGASSSCQTETHPGDFRLHNSLRQTSLRTALGTDEGHMGLGLGLGLGDSRNHLLEVPQRGLDIGVGGYIVFHLVDKRCERYASWVGGGIFTTVYNLLSALCSPEAWLESLHYPVATFFPLSAILTIIWADHCPEGRFPGMLYQSWWWVARACAVDLG